MGGKRRLLAVGKQAKSEAQSELYRVLAGQGGVGTPPQSELTTRDVFNLFLRNGAARVAAGELEPRTLADHKRHLEVAERAVGAIRATEIRNHHLQSWIDSRTTWGPTTRYNALTAVKAAFRWAKRFGHLDANPIADMPRPTPKTREAIPSTTTVQAILDSSPDACFRDLITALVGTGCRPGEVYKLTAADVDLDNGTWRVANKTRRRTGQPTRLVYLTPAIVELSRRLMARWPDGPLFRNSDGVAWTPNAVAQRFYRRRKGQVQGMHGHPLGIEGTAYALRHQYATDALENGVPIATLAELMGHKDTKMIMRIYSKLRHRTEHLRDAASIARPAPPSPLASDQSGPGSPTSEPPDAVDPGHPATPKPGKPRSRRE